MPLDGGRRPPSARSAAHRHRLGNLGTSANAATIRLRDLGFLDQHGNMIQARL